MCQVPINSCAFEYKVDVAEGEKKEKRKKAEQGFVDGSLKDSLLLQRGNHTHTRVTTLALLLQSGQELNMAMRSGTLK